MNIANIIKAMLLVAPTNHEKYYLNAVHFARGEKSCTIEATDGVMALRVECPVDSLPRLLRHTGDSELLCSLSLAGVGRNCEFIQRAAPQGHSGVYTDTDTKIDTVSGNFPRLDRIHNPRKSWNQSANFDTARMQKLIQATHILRKRCKHQVSTVQVCGNFGIQGHNDDIDYVAFLAPYVAE